MLVDQGIAADGAAWIDDVEAKALAALLRCRLVSGRLDELVRDLRGLDLHDLRHRRAGIGVRAGDRRSDDASVDPGHRSDHADR